MVAPFLVVLTGGGAPAVAGGDGVTVDLVNHSGASRTDPYVTILRFFLPEQVPSGSYVDAQQGGDSLAVQQAAARSYYDDGSLKSAVFTVKDEGGARADNAEFSVSLVPTSGSFTDTTSIARSTLTGRDLKIRCKIGGTDYYLLLNNCDTAGTYEELETGPAKRHWKHWGIFRNGQGGSDSDHGQLQGRFYSEVYANGDIRVWAQVINGRVAVGQAYTVDELELLDGASSLVSRTTDFTFYHHNKVDLLGADALPVWAVGSATHIHVVTTTEYLSDHKLLPWIENTPTMISAIGSGSAIDYSPNAVGNVGDVDSTGGSDWIGLVPTWSAQALLTNDKTRVRNDRVNALAQNVKNPVWFVDHVTGQPPVLVSENYSGMPNGDISQGWGVGSAPPQAGSTGGDIGGTGVDYSHRPHYSYLQYLMTGHPAWLDALLIGHVGTFGYYNPGTSQTYTRNATINSVEYETSVEATGQSRGMAWAKWQIGSLVWVINDAHKANAYINQVFTNMLAAWQATLTTPHADAAQATLGVWPGGEGTATGIAIKMFMQNYRALATMMAFHRGQIDATHKTIVSVEKWNIGIINACAYHGAPAYVVAFREGLSPSSSDPIAEDFADVGVGDDDGADPATGITELLISDAGGTSGSCPASGTAASQYAAGHTYATIFHCVTSLAEGQALTAADTANAKMDAIETATGLSEADWGAGQPQWRLRWRDVGG